MSVHNKTDYVTANASFFTAISTAKSTAAQLCAKCSNLGGVAGWEYFDSLPGGSANPENWATTFARAM